MKKIAVLVAPGFEEIETIGIVDILRRGELHCDLVGLENAVTGVHGISIQCDKVIGDKISQEYDMIVLLNYYLCQGHLSEFSHGP